MSGFDVVVDGTDNFPARYLVNDACVLAGKRSVWASVHRFEGQASVFGAPGPCYRCLHPQPPPEGAVPSCAEGGVLGVLPGLLGVIQAVETVKLLLGRGEPLSGRLLLVDALAMAFREIRLRRDPDCAVCGDRPSITRLEDLPDYCLADAAVAEGVGGARVLSSAPMMGRGPAIPEVSVEELHAMRERGDAVVLVDVREPHEYGISDLPGAIKIPLGSLPASLAKLSKDDEIAVYCRAGGRSGQAVGFLQQQGFTKARNVAGGINRWAEKIDPSLPQY